MLGVYVDKFWSYRQQTFLPTVRCRLGISVSLSTDTDGSALIVLLALYQSGSLLFARRRLDVFLKNCAWLFVCMEERYIYIYIITEIDCSLTNL